mmetsp:Transcript_59678/g.158824  ORF Transcript_59678/g.158824 Transcript_59678/m.158824 type:complete len:104 (+) Transcript_59678:469-780(+)
MRGFDKTVQNTFTGNRQSCTIRETVTQTSVSASDLMIENAIEDAKQGKWKCFWGALAEGGTAMTTSEVMQGGRARCVPTGAKDLVNGPLINVRLQERKPRNER